MLNYGTSIASSFPKGFCSAPSLAQCHLCGIINGAKINSNNLNQTRIKYELIVKVEKCLHCDLNICDQCLNSTSINNKSMSNNCIHNTIDCDYKSNTNSNNSNDENEDYEEINNHKINNEKNKSDTASNKSYDISYSSNMFEQHFKTIKKEFKHNYNYIKGLTNNVNNLQDSIKYDESNLNELNLIKQQINAKASDLIKQIENEKNELNDIIDAIINEYEM